jgi:hypothetical protein
MLLASVPAQDQARAEEVLDNLKLRLDKLVVAITTRVRVASSLGQNGWCMRRVAPTSDARGTWRLSGVGEDYPTIHLISHVGLLVDPLFGTRAARDLWQRAHSVDTKGGMNPPPPPPMLVTRHHTTSVKQSLVGASVLHLAPAQAHSLLRLDERLDIWEKTRRRGRATQDADAKSVWGGVVLCGVGRLVQDPDRVGFNIAAVFKVLSELQMLQAPALPYTLPPQYDNLPRLTGRATAQFTLMYALLTARPSPPPCATHTSTNT